MLRSSIAGWVLLMGAVPAAAQVDDSLLWIGGDNQVVTLDRGDLFASAFDATGSLVFSYSMDRFSAVPGPTDPPATGFIIDDNGVHWTTEDTGSVSTPYVAWVPPNGSAPTPSGVWDPYNTFGAPPRAGLVDVDMAGNGLRYALDENGYLFSLNFSPVELLTVLQFDVGPGETAVGLEASQTHVYAFVENDATRNVTVYRKRLDSPEPVTVVASGLPYQALAVLPDGALILADVEHNGSLVRAGSITRTGGAAPGWAVPLDKPVIDLAVVGGELWALDADSLVYALDIATGASSPAAGLGGPTASFDSLVPGPLGFLRGMHPGEEDYVAPVDQCPRDPDKFLPGDCGCDYRERVAFGFETGVEGLACLHQDAEVDDNAFLSAGVRIDSFAVVEAFADVRDGAIISTRSFVGSEALVGMNTVISRRARVESCAQIFDDVIVGREVTVGDGAFVFDGAVIGFDSDIPADSQIGENAMIGTHVAMGPFGPVFIGVNGTLGVPATVARSAQIGSNARVYAGAVVGPEATLGSGVVVESPVRINKQATIGSGSYIEAPARVGRRADIGSNVGLLGGVSIGSNAVIDDGVCPDSSVNRAETVSSPACSTPFNTSHSDNWAGDYFPNLFCGFGGPT